MSLFTLPQTLSLQPLCLRGGVTHPVDSIVVHHTGSPNSSLEGMHMDHLAKGWGGLGYHFIVCNGRHGADGEVQHGRPVWARGAHSASNNAGRIGIAFVGDFSHDAPSPRQLSAFIYLVEGIMRVYGNLEVWPHYAVPGSSTLCPGAATVRALSDLGVVWHTQ